MRGDIHKFGGDTAVTASVRVADPEGISLTKMGVERRCTCETGNRGEGVQFEPLGEAIGVTHGMRGHEQ